MESKNHVELQQLLLNYHTINLDAINYSKPILNCYYGVMPKKDIDVESLNCICEHLIEFAKHTNLTILIADIHSYLVHEYSTDVELWTNNIIKTIKQFMGEAKYEIKLGSSFQTCNNYNLDLMKMCSKVDINQTQIYMERFKDCTKISDLIYPLMQVLDETYLEADIEIGDIHQLEIFNLSVCYLYKLGYRRCLYVVL